MVEIINNKSVGDLDQPNPTSACYVVQVLLKNKVAHYLVRAETAIDALIYTQDSLNAPVIGVSFTEFKDYLDSTKKDKISEKENTEETKETMV